jgi:tmRNA-binding protein
MAINPPNTNGEMTLTDVQMKAIKDKLVAIRDSFVPTDEQGSCTTHYLTATYNAANTLKINGDTCQALLAPEQPTEV